jgi:class 3 adenylate cyclase
VEQARDALRRHAWQEAFEILSTADAEAGGLDPYGLELMARAAWWTGHLPMSIEIRERAYGAATRSGDPMAAVMAAIGLAQENLLRNDVHVANAWMSRADHLLSGIPEGGGHGHLAAIRAFANAVTGDHEASLRNATYALELGERLGDADLAAIAKAEKGFALVAGGRVEEGLALVDEATVAAVGGELEPSVAGGVCCTSIEACAAVGEWTRAATWTEAQDRWCRREGINGYPGMCRLFRSEIKQLRGSWLEAEAEARQASVELEGFNPAATGKAFYRIAELRLLRGDLRGADEAIVRAHGFGIDPEPVLSLIRLAEGRVDVAAAGIRRALDEPTTLPNWRAPPGSPLHRLPLLRARVEVALAGGDVATAREAADELARISEGYDSAYVAAAAASADGAVAVAENRMAEAVGSLRRAVKAWTGLAAPHEAARARLLLADAYIAEGATENAILELQAARIAFEQVGATPDVHRADERLARVEAAEDRPTGVGERVARTFVFTDIVDSTRLAAVLGDEAWGRLLHWHDQAIRTVVAEHGGEEIKATGDGFFLAFADAGAAIDAMIAAQRRLARQREEQGFAPLVRIGIHAAEANRTGTDYLGVGVNYAARIGAAAGDGEILVSDSTLASARRGVDVNGRRTLRLKGISEPVAVSSIGWH